LPATADSVGMARGAVRRFAADLDVDVDKLVLAVSEAVSNVVSHAYVGRPRGAVELCASASASEVTLVVSDSGCGLSDGGATGGAGLGLLIIERLAQAVELTDTSRGVALTMRFRRG
jgi:anti-sigma regulatory factor (Ser/Thr protein kinase)